MGADRFSWQLPDGSKRGSFKATPGTPKLVYKLGEKRFSSKNKVPTCWEDKEAIYSASLFVGFSRGDGHTWLSTDLMKLVKSVRRTQTKHLDSSLMYREGAYTHETVKDGNSQIITEVGTQVTFYNIPPMIRRLSVFRKNVMCLAEMVCREMHQETVIVRIDKNGTAIETTGVIE